VNGTLVRLVEKSLKGIYLIYFGVVENPSSSSAAAGILRAK